MRSWTRVVSQLAEDAMVEDIRIRVRLSKLWSGGVARLAAGDPDIRQLTDAFVAALADSIPERGQWSGPMSLLARARTGNHDLDFNRRERR